MPESELRLPPIQFPILGNSGAVGLFSLLHISLAGLTVGFIVLAPLLEYLGMKDPFYTRLGRSLVRFVAVVFSISAVFAVVMVELFIGLFPVSTVYIFRRFELGVYIAIVVFFLHIFFFYTYWYRWEKMRAKSIRRHITWGAIAALLGVTWGALLDGIGSYMLTPPDRELAGLPRFAVAHLSFLLNPTWVPLVLHRFVGNMIISFYAIGLYGGLRLLSASLNPEEEAYYTRIMQFGIVVGTGLLMLQPIAGMLYSIQIRRANPQAFERILFGPVEWLVRVQFLLVGLLFFLSNRFFAQISTNPRHSRVLNRIILAAAILMVLTVQQVWLRRALTFALVLMTLYHFSLILLRGKPFPFRRQGPWLAISVGCCAMAIFLVMGVIREQARRPYTVYGEIHLQDEKQPVSEFVQR
jgi:cytochrome d ubiquinol oxidase subunit I